MKEQELTDRIRTGDKQAFRELVDTYQDKVYNTVYSFVRNSDDSLDLCQDVFVEVFRSFVSFRGDCGLSTWIYRIAVNKAINYARKKKSSSFLFSSGSSSAKNTAENNSNLADSSSHPSEILENKELGDQLQKALATLPDNQRIAFLLHKTEDLPYAEIAEIMKISLSSVESLIHRARKNLQKKLLNYWRH
jgi:RNA polymerase sigma factor (sigma-70 family)